MKPNFQKHSLKFHTIAENTICFESVVTGISVKKNKQTYKSEVHIGVSYCHFQ